MRKFRVQSRAVPPRVAPESPAGEPNTGETWRRLGVIRPANDQIEILPMSDGGDGISTTSGPPDPPPDPDPDEK